MEEWRARLAAVSDALRCTRAEAAALAVLLAGTLAGLGVVWWLAQPGPASHEVDAAGSTPADTAAPDDGGGEGAGGEAFVDDGDPLLVHVAGEVAEPGVVEVPAGSRVGDAIEAVGGPTDDADLGVVNLARAVDDGEQIVVGHVDHREDGGEVPGVVGPDGKIDVNRADADTLQQVPGIGPVTAERLVSHREEHGRFTAEQDLLEVSGIGERTLDQLVDHLRW